MRLWSMPCRWRCITPACRSARWPAYIVPRPPRISWLARTIRWMCPGGRIWWRASKSRSSIKASLRCPTSRAWALRSMKMPCGSILCRIRVTSSPRQRGIKNAPGTGCGAWHRESGWWVLGPRCWHASVLSVCIGVHLWLIPVLAADVRQIFERGQRAMDAGDLSAAEKDFRAVLAAEPDNVGAHGNLAVVHMRRKEWKAALSELQAAERLAPKIPGIRLNIGLVYYRQADYRQAIAPFESVLRDQDSRQARYLLGLCYFFTERYADAAATLQPL